VVQALLEQDRVVVSAGVAERDPAVLGPEVRKEQHRENG